MTFDAPTSGKNGNAASPSSAKPPSAADETDKQPPVRSSKLKLWCFRLGAIALSVFVIAILETLLVVFGVGSDLGHVVKVPG